MRPDRLGVLFDPELFLEVDIVSSESGSGAEFVCGIAVHVDVLIVVGPVVVR